MFFPAKPASSKPAIQLCWKNGAGSYMSSNLATGECDNPGNFLLSK
jgi:hypothetical protein